jgi:hypothetical protein
MASSVAELARKGMPVRSACSARISVTTLWALTLSFDAATGQKVWEQRFNGHDSADGYTSESARSVVVNSSGSRLRRRRGTGHCLVRSRRCADLGL